MSRLSTLSAEHTSNRRQSFSIHKRCGGSLGFLRHSILLLNQSRGKCLTQHVRLEYRGPLALGDAWEQEAEDALDRGRQCVGYGW